MGNVESVSHPSCRFAGVHVPEVFLILFAGHVSIGVFELGL